MVKRLERMVTLLDRLNHIWDPSYMLFADNGNLCLVDRHTGRIINRLDDIPCDGGDPDHECDENGVFIKQVC